MATPAAENERRANMAPYVNEEVVPEAVGVERKGDGLAGQARARYPERAPAPRGLQAGRAHEPLPQLRPDPRMRGTAPPAENQGVFNASCTAAAC